VLALSGLSLQQREVLLRIRRTLLLTMAQGSG